MNAIAKVWPLPGGVHPPENKHQSTGSAIAEPFFPSELVLPLSQHIGAPSKLVVQAGDAVLKGQLLAECQGNVSAAVHAPTSGTISAIEERAIAHASGMSAMTIVLKPDGKDTWRERQPWQNWRDVSREQIFERIANAGVVGLGGAGFPTATKLGFDPSRIDTLVLNGTECEPYITADDMIMRERADEIVAGAQIMADLLQVDRVLIGIEDNKPEAIAAMTAAIPESLSARFVVKTFATKYPSGGEKQLIWILTGQEVPSGRIPADLGMVCQNVGTAAAVYRAVVQDEPLISRITTVTGDAVGQPGNREVLIGTPMQELLQAHNVNLDKADRLVMGGPMMGVALADPNVPIVKTTNCLLLPTRKELPLAGPEMPCIRCGHCEQACPAGLLPQQMLFYAKNKELERLEQQNLFDCIECGACAYVCPSDIPLVQYYRFGKGEIRREQAEQEKSDRAKARFEARQARLEAQQAAKEAKRKARAESARKAAEAKKQAGGEAPAAITKATNKVAAASGPLDLAALEKAVSTAQAKVDQAIIKLNEAKETDPQSLPAFERALAKFEEKLTKAKTALNEAKNKADDPVERAKRQAAAKAAGIGPSVDDLQKKVDTQRQRLQKIADKLAAAKDNGEDTAAIEKGMQATQARLDKAEAELAQAKAAAPVERTNDDSNSDVGAKAIEAAKEAAAKRAAGIGPSKDELREKVEKQQARLAKIDSKLAEAKAAGNDTAAIEKGRESTAKRLEKMQAELAQLEE